AIVVGGSAEGGQDLHCDALGRIKVRFHFQDGDGHHDSAWLRVMQRYAGPGVGSQFLPRIGQEVLVGFLEDEIDRPIVLGALYNGLGEAGVPRTPGGNAGQSDLSIYTQAQDHRPSAQANLGGGQAPVWHGWGPGEDQHRNPAAQWGIRSQEWGGSGYSQLVFDDSNGQLRTQLATTQAATQLNLGHLIHSADNYRGSFRGEGFELRTDAWGSVRCERGLWLSAYAHNQNEPAGLAVQQVALLNQLNALGKTFSQAAKTHLTSPLAAHEGINKPSTSQLSETQAPLAILQKSASTTVTGTELGTGYTDAPQRETSAGNARVPHTGDPILGISAPAGVMHVAGQALHWNAGETLTLASGQDSDAAIMHRARLHSGQAIGVLAAASKGQREDTALSIVAGEGELDIQAQHDQIKLQAKDHLHVASRSAEVELAAGKTIHIATAGGASITIENGNITFNAPGEIKVQAGRKSFVGATQLSREMNEWPDSKFDQRVKMVLRSGKAACNQRYEIHRADGAVIRGITDGDGWTQLQQGISLDGATVKWLGKA
ncbi:DUF2345 domain-containing protein, partial [Thermomonas sp.]|uniref:DUF2345 domain-containing protein n=1 Tax=Thermomonas sp. TaxID=1971895 RepID=UPI00261AA813